MILWRYKQQILSHGKQPDYLIVLPNKLKEKKNSTKTYYIFRVIRDTTNCNVCTFFTWV